MHRRLLIVPLAAAVALGACGGSHESERQDVEKAVKSVYTALADKDSKKICASISEKGRKEISDAAARRGKKKQSCEEVFNVALVYAGDALQEAKSVKVSDVKVDGDKAKANITLNKRTSEVGLVKEDGEWKLGGLDLR